MDRSSGASGRPRCDSSTTPSDRPWPRTCRWLNWRSTSLDRCGQMTARATQPLQPQRSIHHSIMASANFPPKVSNDNARASPPTRDRHWQLARSLALALQGHVAQSASLARIRNADPIPGTRPIEPSDGTLGGLQRMCQPLAAATMPPQPGLETLRSRRSSQIRSGRPRQARQANKQRRYIPTLRRSCPAQGIALHAQWSQTSEGSAVEAHDTFRRCFKNNGHPERSRIPTLPSSHHVPPKPARSIPLTRCEDFLR